MFGRLATVRIKTAEDAFAEGRLDDAFEIAIAPDLSDNRRIQRLRKELANALLKRGQDHLLSKRFDQAAADFERAARCGYFSKKIREWRQRAREAIEADRKAQAERAAALAGARHRLDAGSLVGAADELHRAPTDDAERAAIAEAIDARGRRAERELSAAKAAFKEGKLRAAAEKLHAVRDLHNKLAGLAEMESKLVDRVVEKATESFRNGRLDRAQQDLAALGDIGRNGSERVELEEAVRLAKDAAKALSENRYARASVLIGRLAQMSPKAGWLSDVRQHLDRVEEERRALLEGPLGLISGPQTPGRSKDPIGKAFNGDDTLPAALPPVQPAMADRRGAPDRSPRLPRRLLLRIDGVGSFLLVRGDRIGIGRSGPDATADLQLVSDLAERQAEIIRAGEDYFVVARAGVELAGRHTDHALLQDGDRIRLSKRIRLTFRRPSLKSTAAALDLADGVRMATDCRRVILWSGPILMGGTRECHVRLSSQLGDFVLMERGGRLYVKPMKLGSEAMPVVLGEQTVMGELRFSVSDWSNGLSRGGAIA